LEQVTRNGYLPLHHFIGMLATRLSIQDTREFYKFRKGVKSLDGLQSAVVYGAETAAEFYRKNKHLGTNLLNAVLEEFFDYGRGAPKKEIKLEQTQSMFVGVRIPYPLELQAMINEVGFEEASLAPDWVWEMTPFSAFRVLLSVTTIGAIEMATNELKRDCGPGKERIFTEKLLLSSPGVNDKFVDFVANKYKGGSDAVGYQGPVNMRGGNNISRRVWMTAGHGTRIERAVYSLAAKQWFKDVIRVRKSNVHRPPLEEYRSADTVLDLRIRDAAEVKINLQHELDSAVRGGLDIQSINQLRQRYHDADQVMRSYELQKVKYKRLIEAYDHDIYELKHLE